MTDGERWMEELRAEGFTDLRVCPTPPAGSPEHTHDLHTVHVVLRGELVIEDDGGRRTYLPGDRVEFPANTTHTAGTIGGDGEMIVGVKP